MTPSARAAPRTKVVLPEPSSPETVTTSPGTSARASRAATASVSSGDAGRDGARRAQRVEHAADQPPASTPSIPRRHARRGSATLQRARTHRRAPDRRGAGLGRRGRHATRGRRARRRERGSATGRLRRAGRRADARTRSNPASAHPSPTMRRIARSLQRQRLDAGDDVDGRLRREPTYGRAADVLDSDGAKRVNDPRAPRPRTAAATRRRIRRDGRLSILGLHGCSPDPNSRRQRRRRAAAGHRRASLPCPPSPSSRTFHRFRARCLTPSTDARDSVLPKRDCDAHTPCANVRCGQALKDRAGTGRLEPAPAISASRRGRAVPAASGGCGSAGAIAWSGRRRRRGRAARSARGSARSPPRASAASAACRARLPGWKIG